MKFIMLINVKMHGNFNIWEVESKKSLYFSAYLFLWAVEISCSVEMSMKNIWPGCLVQGFAKIFQVIKGTIQCDLMKVTKEAREVEQKLRAERIKLIRQKVEESGGDIKGLNEAGKFSGCWCSL